VPDTSTDSETDPNCKRASTRTAADAVTVTSLWDVALESAGFGGDAIDAG
jgi:hypothetical protein